MKEKSIEKIAILNIVKNISATLFPLIIFAYVSRILNPTGLGKVTFARSYISYFSMAASFGISIYGVRECAKYRQDKEKLSKTVQELLIINTITLTISYMILFLSVISISTLRIKAKEICLMSIIMVAQIIAVEWVYAALEDYMYITVRTILVHILSLFLVFLCVNDANDILTYILILVVVEVVIGLVNFIHAKKYVLIKKYHKYDLKQHIKPAAYFFLAAVSANLFTNSDCVMLGFLASDYEIGMYTAGTKVCTMIFSVVASLAISIMPRLSYYFEAKKTEEYKTLTYKIFDYLMMLTIPAAIGMVMLAKEVIILISGNAYEGAGVIAQIMAVGIVAYAVVVFVHYEIMGPQNNEKLVMKTTIISATVNIVLNFVFIYYFKAKGAAVATVLSKIFFATICIWYSRKEIDIKELLRRSLLYIKAATIIIPVCFIAKQIFEETVLITVFGVILSVIGYFSILWLSNNSYVNEIVEKVSTRIKK